MKKLNSLSAVLLVSTLTTPVFATPLYHPPGSNLSYGAISNGQSIMSDITNPAAGASVFIKNNGQFRFGILSSIGFGYEIGDVNDLETRVDATITQFTDTVNSTALVGTNVNANVNRILGLLNADINTTNLLLTDIQTNGYFTGFASLHAPIMPLVISHKALTGSFVLDVNFSAIGNVSFLSDQVNPLVAADIEAAVAAALTGSQTTVDLGDLIASDSSIIVKGAAISELSFGYSTSVWKNDDEQIFVGLRGNYFKIDLTRFVQKLDDSSGQNLNTIFEDNKDTNEIATSGIGLDLGVLWVGKHSRAGATLKNINKPTFDYNTIDTSLFTDSDIIGEIQKGNAYEMEPQLRLEGAFFTANQNWVFGVALDANAIDDAVGQEYQWATASAAYATDSWFIPGVRFGYRANLAGTELSFLTTGVTMGAFNLDIAYGLEEVTIDQGDLTSTTGNIPRSVIINMGLELTF